MSTPTTLSTHTVYNIMAKPYANCKECRRRCQEVAGSRMLFLPQNGTRMFYERVKPKGGGEGLFLGDIHSGLPLSVNPFGCELW